MISRLLTNELARKRWRDFKSNRLGLVSLILLLVLGFFSFTAEFWANNRPIYLKYQEQSYWPVITDVHPSRLGIENAVTTDYANLKFADGDWALWPVIHWDPYVRNEKLAEFPAPPSSVNWLGADESGRDVAARLLYGFRYSITYAIAVWLMSSIFGIFSGAVMGYLAGWSDLAGQRIIEIIESLPALMILITLGSIFSPGLGLLVFFSSLFSWVGISLYVRAEFLKLRRREFVEAAKALGQSHRQIIFKHILPNSLTPWISVSPFMIAGGVISLAILDYLGYGLQAPSPSWGELLGQAQKHFRLAWWLAVFPTTALAGTLMLLNLVGMAVRDAFDPRKG